MLKIIREFANHNLAGNCMARADHIEPTNFAQVLNCTLYWFLELSLKIMKKL